MIVLPGVYDIRKVIESFSDWYFYKNGSLRHLFSRNNKMIETTLANDGKYFINFNIPALETCTCAGACKNICYATSGRYVFKNVLDAMLWRYNMTTREDFRWFADDEIEYWKKKAKGRTLYVRVHDSGDYYSRNYALKWIQIAKDNPDCVFYSYTKCVSLWHELQDEGLVPENYRIIMSTFGTQDKLIRPDDRRAIIVQDKEHIKEGMVDGTGNDFYATYASIVALPYHGQKKVKIDG